MLLFLLMQITIGLAAPALVVGVSNPWTEYVKMLPNSIPLPTMWIEEERAMLVGTSLEVSFFFSAVEWSRSYFQKKGFYDDGVLIPAVGGLVLLGYQILAPRCRSEVLY